MRAKSELKLARYALKDSDLMLHPEFLRRLRALPETYVYGEFRQLFLDYGTHYITEAELGGEYVHTVILNKEKLEKTGNSLILKGTLQYMTFVWATHTHTHTILHLC